MHENIVDRLRYIVNNNATQIRRTPPAGGRVYHRNSRHRAPTVGSYHVGHEHTDASGRPATNWHPLSMSRAHSLIELARHYSAVDGPSEARGMKTWDIDTDRLATILAEIEPPRE